jgi:outer membrane protein assembly factor BamB
MTNSYEIVPMILPTVMIPLTMVSVGLSVVASFIAALFGIQLKLEGPKKLLEVLLKPKVLGWALAMNIVILGGVWGWKWWKNYPRLISTLETESDKRAKPSALDYENHPTVQTHFSSEGTQSMELQSITQLWRIHTGKGSFRAPVVMQGRILSGNDLGVVSEIELMSGKILRSFYIGTPVSAEITVWNKSLYLGEGVHDTHHARVYRFDLKSGKFTGSYQTLGHTEGQAVMGSHGGEDTLFVVAGIDGLHAVDPVSMSKKWKVNLGHMDAGISVDGDRVFIGTGREKHDDKKNKCYAAALDFKTGKILWQRELAASSWMRPVVINDDVCYVAGEIYFPTQRGHISCFDRVNGTPTAALNTTDPLAATPKVLDESILYASIHGQVCRFDLKTKKNLWCFDAQEKDFSLAAPSWDPRGRVVLYPSMSKGLFILDADNGKLLKLWKPSSEQGEWKKIYADVTVSGDYWILADDDGSVRALRANFSPKLAQGYH